MEPVTVVVPVLRRPHNAEPFMASLRDAAGDEAPPPVIAVANVDDEGTAEAWRRAGALVQDFVGQPGSYGQKANLMALTLDDCEWMFLTGDDVAFCLGWLENALRDLPEEACVVGTNDLANPRVTSGDHAVHFFLRMDYVRDRGASWDGPGTVAGPYRHWFSDDEIITIAKMRGVFEPRLDSVVEHRHPYFAEGVELDDVYRIGEEHAAADRALFEERVERFAPELLYPTAAPPGEGGSPPVVDLT